MTRKLQQFFVAILLFATCLTTSLPMMAEKNDSLHAKLYSQFLELYNSSSREAFYEVAEQLSNYYRENGMLKEYYKIQVNICFYDTGQNRTTEALKRANDMFEEMKADGFDAYSQIYQALGTIFESRGNYRMAHHYYEESIKTLSLDDQGNLMSAYARIACLTMFRDPVEADYWNKKYEEMSLSSPPYRQVYLFIDAIINFTLGNARGFQKSFLEYQNYHAAHPGLDNYGRNALEIANLAIEGHYEQALDSLTNSNSVDLSAISKYDMGILIYKKMDRYDKALALEQKKEEYKDSLNSDLLYSNMNELNAQLGVAQAESKAVKVRETMLITVLVMSAIMIVLLVLWLMRNRRSKEELKQKNEQLNAALAMAEEGERMKTEFVRSVSHEIRTPLNAINGFNDVLNTPGLEIPEEERKDMLQRIYENTKAITNIVDEMLRVADKESNEYASRDDKLYCNNFFSALLYSYRDKVSSAIELNYTTRLMNRFQLETNEEGVRKIIDHLIQNAIKFTRKGQINLHCELSGDNTMLLVSLSDTGTGIKAEVRDKIFEGFYKADTFQQGIGLGLTVSKKIAKKLGGDLTLDDSYTSGARFVLSLPAV